jgi:hypothetical protein
MAFVWNDPEPTAHRAKFQFPIAMVEPNGRMVAYPKAIIAAAQSVKDADWLSEKERAACVHHLERYFAKMGEKSPFDESDRQFFSVTDLQGWNVEVYVNALQKAGVFSNGAINILRDHYKAREQGGSGGDTVSTADLLSTITAVREGVRS